MMNLTALPTKPPIEGCEAFEIPMLTEWPWRSRKDKDKCQECPEAPPELAGRLCVWGYEISDENFLAYETEYPESTVSPFLPNTRRIKLVERIAEEIGIQHEPKVWMLYGKERDTFFVYWVRHPRTYDDIYGKPTVPCEELLRKLRDALRFKVEEQWFDVSQPCY